MNYIRSFNSYIINSKLNKQYKDDDSEYKKVLEDRTNRKKLKKLSKNNNIYYVKRSKTSGVIENKQKSNPTPKCLENKKSIVCLGVKKQYNEDVLR